MNLTNNISEDVKSNVKIVASPEARTEMCCDYFFLRSQAYIGAGAMSRTRQRAENAQSGKGL